MFVLMNVRGCSCCSLIVNTQKQNQQLKSDTTFSPKCSSLCPCSWESDAGAGILGSAEGGDASDGDFVSTHVIDRRFGESDLVIQPRVERICYGVHGEARVSMRTKRRCKTTE